MSSTRSIGALAALLTFGACKERAPEYPTNAPSEVMEACAMTERKCTACHDRERFLTPRHSPGAWREIVERMRRFPGSSIAPTEAEIILRCLNYRSSARSPDMGSQRAIPQRDEVQAMHFDLHNRLHFEPPKPFAAFGNVLGSRAIDHGPDRAFKSPRD